MSVTLPKLNARWPRYIVAVFALAWACSGRIGAQQPTDTSVQASPVAPPPKAPAIDSSVQASPIPGPAAKSDVADVAPGTAIAVRLTEPLNSGTLQNGAVVHATLTAPVKLSGAPQTPSIPAGAEAELSVIETVPADKIDSAGEITLQLMRVGTVDVFTDTQTFNGKPGHRELPDSIPKKGTEARLAAGATLTFHVQPPPTAATGPAK